MSLQLAEKYLLMALLAEKYFCLLELGPECFHYGLHSARLYHPIPFQTVVMFDGSGGARRSE